MAIKKTLPFNGTQVPDTYLRVEDVQLLGKERLSFKVRGYATLEAGAFYWAGFEAPYVMDGSNPIAQAYDYLKTLPEFSGAIDC